MRRSEESILSKLPDKLKGLSRGEWIGIALVLTIVFYGLSQIGHGLYIKTKSQMAQLLLQKAWQQAESGQAISKPWPWADTWPVAKLTVPKLGQSTVVLSGVSGEAMAFGPGYHTETPAPGQSGTSVIAAHRDTHFRFLEYLNLGDQITIKTPHRQSQSYIIKRFRVVKWDQSGIDPDAPGQNLALVTCWPFEVNSQGPLRFVVEAEGINDASALLQPDLNGQQHL